MCFIQDFLIFKHLEEFLEFCLLHICKQTFFYEFLNSPRKVGSGIELPFKAFITGFCYPYKDMDSLRVFSTFHSTTRTFNKRPKAAKKAMPRDENGMTIRSLDEKPHVSRQEILDKLKKSKEGTLSAARNVKGKKFGMDFWDGEEAVGDVKKNDPRDPMTSEKLKSMLHSGAVNFNGKEKEILSKILGN